MFLEDLNNVLQSAQGDEEMFMVQSLLFPLMAWKAGREFILSSLSQHRDLLKHLAGENFPSFWNTPKTGGVLAFPLKKL